MAQRIGEAVQTNKWWPRDISCNKLKKKEIVTTTLRGLAVSYENKDDHPARLTSRTVTVLLARFTVQMSNSPASRPLVYYKVSVFSDEMRCSYTARQHDHGSRHQHCRSRLAYFGLSRRERGLCLAAQVTSHPWSASIFRRESASDAAGAWGTVTVILQQTLHNEDSLARTLDHGLSEFGGLQCLERKKGKAMLWCQNLRCPNTSPSQWDSMGSG